MKKIITLCILCLMAVSMQAQRIAVLEFSAGVGISQADVDGISSIFITYFRPQGYTLVERTLIDKVIDEQQFQRGKLTESQMVRIGRLLNVSKVVVGQINIVMGQYNVDVRAINVETGTVAATAGDAFDNATFRTKMQTIAQSLAKKIAITPTSQATPAESQKPQQPQQLQNPVSYSNGVLTVNGVQYCMIKVEGGTFTMGATSEQGSDAYDDEKPTHQVTLSTYYIGRTEVTQALWEAVMGSNPSGFKGKKLPVENVSYNDCKQFIEKLNVMTGQDFRLPTEAEWEFAARGGNQSHGYKYSGSNYLDDVAWFRENSGSETNTVATKRPNELGIYDMSGNVYEWCRDSYAKYTSSPQTNPRGGSGSDRVCRGGGWDSGAGYCRVSNRNGDSPDLRNYDLGLRLVLSE